MSFKPLILSFSVLSFGPVIQAKSISITPIEKVIWEKLNPARGDKSPQAATLWGDRHGNPATGFLAKFVDGFSSPPHIHNVSYRAIVIEGLVHNDDPKAEFMWMPAGSYWTQPAGESHITSAKGKKNIALVEIDHGPYLVKPVKSSFDNGERPFNIHKSNIIWRDNGEHSVVDLWADKNGKVTGSMLKFNQKFSISDSDLKVVVIEGQVKLLNQTLKPGSLIQLSHNVKAKLDCLSPECVLYLKRS